MIEAFGSYARTPADGPDGPWWTIGTYLITARCAARCHTYRRVIDLERFNDPVGVLDAEIKRVSHAFADVHPWGW